MSDKEFSTLMNDLVSKGCQTPHMRKLMFSMIGEIRILRERVQRLEEGPPKKTSTKSDKEPE